MTTPTGTAIEQRENGPGALVSQYKADFALVLPTHIKPDQWVRVAQGLLRRDKNLARVAQANPGSFLSAMLRCAHLGLEPGDTFHLVAFGNEIVGITSYTGEIELIYRAGEVASIIAEVVCTNDDFTFTPGTMDRPEHHIDWFGDRGELIGAYAYALMKNGAVSRVVVMSKKEIEKVKAVSRSSSKPSSPWQQWPDRMYLKTVVKRLAKWIPSSAEYQEALLRQTSVVQDVSTELRAELPDDPTAAVEDDDVLDADVIDDDIVDAELVDDDQEPAGEPEPPAPEPATSSDAQPIAEGQTKALTALLRGKGVVGPERFDLLSSMLGRDVVAMRDITWDEAATLIDTLQGEASADDAA